MPGNNSRPIKLERRDGVGGEFSFSVKLLNRILQGFVLSDDEWFTDGQFQLLAENNQSRQLKGEEWRWAREVESSLVVDDETWIQDMEELLL